MNGETLRNHPFWIIVGAAVATLALYTVTSFIGTVVFGVFLYYISRPVYNRISVYIRYNAVAAAISLGFVALPLIATLVSLGITAIQQYRIAEQELDLLQILNPYIDTALGDATIENVSALPVPTTVDAARRALDLSLQYVSVLGVTAAHLFVVIVIAFYLLRDDRNLVAWTVQFDNEERHLQRYMRAVDTDFHAIFFGNILSAFAAGAIGAILYTVLNTVSPATATIPVPVLIGALVGFASLIPIVGMKIVYVPVTAYLFVQAYTTAAAPEFWFPTVFLITSFVIVDTIPDLVLRPYVSGKNTHIGLLMVAYILGPFLFGWYGLFLAPMLLVFGIQYARIIMPEVLTETTDTAEEQTHEDKPIPLVGIYSTDNRDH